MRLVCPRCAAAYEVPPTVLGERRTVRCARCGMDWVEHGERPGETDEASTGPAGSADAAPARAAAPPGMVAHPRPPVWRGDAMALRAGWAASLLILAIGMWGAVAWRSTMMHAWPPSQRFYGALGLARGHPEEPANSRSALPSPDPLPRGKTEAGAVQADGG